MYYWKLSCIQRFYPGMNCVSLVMLLFVRQIKMIYSLKLDNQAVDKKNTEDYSPCGNVNYINLRILCCDCLDLPIRSKTSRVGRRSAKDGKDQKTVWRLAWFIDLCKTLLTLRDWFPLGQRAFTITEIWLVSHVNHASRTCKIENHASSCDVRFRVTRIIWVQSRVTLQILGPSRVMQKPFVTLLMLWYCYCYHRRPKLQLWDDHLAQ